MTAVQISGQYPLGDRSVKRMGYGAMQLAGPQVFGPPKDADAALAVLRAAIAAGSTISTPATSTGPSSPTS